MSVDLPAGLSPKQEAFMRGSNGRINILEGSVRSGKTIVSLLRWLIFIISTSPGPPCTWAWQPEGR